MIKPIMLNEARLYATQISAVVSVTFPCELLDTTQLEQSFYARYRLTSRDKLTQTTITISIYGLSVIDIATDIIDYVWPLFVREG